MTLVGWTGDAGSAEQQRGVLLAAAGHAAFLPRHSKWSPTIRINDILVVKSRRSFGFGRILIEGARQRIEFRTTADDPQFPQVVGLLELWARSVLPLNEPVPPKLM